MDPLIAILLTLPIGLAAGFVLGTLVAAARRHTAPPSSGAAENLELTAARLQTALAEQLMTERAAQAQLTAELAAAQATVRALSAQVAAADEHTRELTERQRTEYLAQRERERRESKVLEALSPVQETLRTMQVTVSELEAQRSAQYGAITEQLTATRQSGEQIRATAESLAAALKSNSVRGVWGETQLRNIVEAAGLTHRVDFDLQSSTTSDAGTGRADLVVRLPGGKSIAVDAKVPFAAYMSASQIPDTATGAEAARRNSLLKEHVRAVRAHIDALAARTYWDGLSASPEFVVAFIPSESLLSTALAADPTLLEYSFSKKVALASPVNLWAVLKTVAYTWQQDVLTDDAKRLFDLGRILYQRLATLADHADSLRRAIDRTVDSYNRFAGSLEGRVLVTARQMNALDETKILPRPGLIETTAKKLTALELAAELTAAEPDPGAEQLDAELIGGRTGGRATRQGSAAAAS